MTTIVSSRTLEMRSRFAPLAAAWLAFACEGGFAASNETRDSSHESAQQADADQEPAAPDAEPEPGEHLLVWLSYESGSFSVERVTRVPGRLRPSRSSQLRSDFVIVARDGATSLITSSATDPRRVHVDYTDSSTQQLQHAEAAMPGRRHLLVHVPLDTDAIDFFDASRPAASLEKRDTESMREPAPGALLGTVRLQPLL